MTQIKKYKIIWSPQARDDLRDIKYYIKNHLKEKNIAINVVKRILNSILDLSYLPEKHAKIQIFNEKTKNVRKMPISNYIVIYEVNHDTRASFYSTYFSQSSKLF